MEDQRLAKWYFGGMASCGAACCTHPLDLLKVHLQTQQIKQMGGGQMAVHIVKNQGFFALYNGLSASLLRQLTYSTTRFAIYEGAIATTMTQPVDVIKTRAMNARPGEFRGLWHIITYTAKVGPLGFFKGYIPAFVRLGPHTIITFILFEQLRKNFGILKKPVQ
ncbi:hypothetical protein OTU49_002552 [Cherax quadricarinatus]|uniref:Uncharacterized protein n=1 Tax=Cherax quadricarinatus TaxID=27406 RepID=A0AAW0XT78_CHEQU